MWQPSLSAAAITAMAGVLYWITSQGAHAFAIVPGPEQCELCVHWQLTPPRFFDFPPFRFYFYEEDQAPFCEETQLYINAAFDTPIVDLADSGVISPMVKKFSAEPLPSCTQTELKFCGIFSSKNDALLSKEVIFAELAAQVGNAENFVCPATGAAYNFRTYTTGCFEDYSEVTCKEGPDPFPDCKCDKRKGITPVYVESVATRDTGRRNRTLYCFSIDRVPDEYRVESACASEKLTKFEMWVDESFRRNVTGFRLTSSSGVESWRYPSWGGSGQGLLKATPIAWTMEEAIGAEVCVEVHPNVSLGSLCKDYACFVSLFNDDKKCCPNYGAARSSPFSLGPKPTRRH